MDAPLICIDVERANAHGAPHLIEVGAVRVERGEIIDHFDALVRPQVPVDPETEALHGLTDRELGAAAEAREVLPELFEWMGEHLLCAHDAPREAEALGFECARAGIDPPENAFLDSFVLARTALPDAPDHSLETLTDLLEIEVDARHRALPDAVSCWKVLEACIERFGGPEKISTVELLAKSKRRVSMAHYPQAPRMRPRHRPLERAIRTGDPVLLHYGEARMAETPSRLAVLPGLLYRLGEHDYLEGLCQNADILKTYRLDRIHKVQQGA